MMETYIQFYTQSKIDVGYKDFVRSTLETYVQATPRLSQEKMSFTSAIVDRAVDITDITVHKCIQEIHAVSSIHAGIEDSLEGAYLSLRKVNKNGAASMLQNVADCTTYEVETTSQTHKCNLTDVVTTTSVRITLDSQLDSCKVYYVEPTLALTVVHRFYMLGHLAEYVQSLDLNSNSNSSFRLEVQQQYLLAKKTVDSVSKMLYTSSVF
ncbi:MAG: hypothetical protein ACTSUE_07010 [Promethearchaeota archaeon]